jgi:hypothetical protein
MRINNIRKYLGNTKLTSEYRGDFFDSKFLRKLDIRIGKVLKNDDEEAIFVVSRKGKDDKRVYNLEILKRVEGNTPGVFSFVNIDFETPNKAAKYYESLTK